jgi:hypothetical protein
VTIAELIWSIAEVVGFTGRCADKASRNPHSKLLAGSNRAGSAGARKCSSYRNTPQYQVVPDLVTPRVTDLDGGLLEALWLRLVHHFCRIFISRSNGLHVRRVCPCNVEAVRSKNLPDLPRRGSLSTFLQYREMYLSKHASEPLIPQRCGKPDQHFQLMALDVNLNDIRESSFTAQYYLIASHYRDSYQFTCINKGVIRGNMRCSTVQLLPEGQLSARIRKP